MGERSMGQPSGPSWSSIPSIKIPGGTMAMLSQAVCAVWLRSFCETMPHSMKGGVVGTHGAPGNALCGKPVSSAFASQPCTSFSCRA